MKSKKFVLAALVLLAITGLLALSGCKNDTVPEPTRYTVKFETAHGTVPADITVESGQTATRPEPDPTKDGWTFLGWYEDSGLTKEFDFSTLVTADITLYAKWRANPGTVVSDGLIIDEIKLEKTSEVQVLSEAVDLKDLYNAASNSQIFVDKRVGAIQPFVMGQYEVTQQLYLAVMKEWGGTEPSSTYGEGDDYPAYYVSWYDAVVFCNELTKEVLGDEACVYYYIDEDVKKVYTKDARVGGETPYMDTSKSGYRLPTEAEWELAARGGDPEAEAWQYTYAGSDNIDGVAWYNDSKTHEVGTKAANSLGLYDMSGNVWEWCWDWDGSIEAGTASGGAASGSLRVARGGGWSYDASLCTVSIRSINNPGYRDSNLGFRLVRSSSK